LGLANHPGNKYIFGVEIQLTKDYLQIEGNLKVNVYKDSKTPEKVVTDHRETRTVKYAEDYHTFINDKLFNILFNILFNMLKPCHSSFKPSGIPGSR